MKMIYEGKAKQVYSTDNPDEAIIKFKDDATAFNGVKKDSFQNKGRLNLAFTVHFFGVLKENGIKTQLIDVIDDTSLKSMYLSIIPLEVVVRNYAAGSICKREGFEKGFEFAEPMVEFFFKDDALGDPLMSKEEILEKNISTLEELNYLKEEALKINAALKSYLDTKDITLVDFKLEFGKTRNGEIILADEISPDTCRFWKKGTMESFDKDVYREDKGDLVDSYTKLANILGVR